MLNFSHNKNLRDWKKFENDEIMTIWKGYLVQEFGNYDNPLGMRQRRQKPIRLTSIEVICLVEELMNRLDVKENGKIDKHQDGME